MLKQVLLWWLVMSMAKPFIVYCMLCKCVGCGCSMLLFIAKRNEQDTNNHFQHKEIWTNFVQCELAQQSWTEMKPLIVNSAAFDNTSYCRNQQEPLCRLAWILSKLLAALNLWFGMGILIDCKLHLAQGVCFPEILIIARQGLLQTMRFSGIAAWKQEFVLNVRFLLQIIPHSTLDLRAWKISFYFERQSGCSGQTALQLSADKHSTIRLSR